MGTPDEETALADAAEHLLSQEYSSQEALKKGEQARVFSKLGVEMMKKCLGSEEDVRRLSAIVLYMEAIARPQKTKTGPSATSSSWPSWPPTSSWSSPSSPRASGPGRTNSRS